MVPLATFMSVNHTLGSELVTRYNLYPAAPIIGIAAPGFSSGQALNLMEQVAANTLPEGMAFDWTATAYQEKQIGRQPYFIYGLSITLVFMVLAALYESWTSPAAVILVVPLGSLLTLLWRRYPDRWLLPTWTLGGAIVVLLSYIFPEPLKEEAKLLVWEDWREPLRGEAHGHGLGNYRILSGVVLACFIVLYIVFR